MRTIVWFRGKDVRLSDHAPLHHALQTGEVVLLFVIDPYFFAPVRARELPHRIQFLLQSLASLQANIAHLGSKLILVEGKSIDVVPALAHRWKADRVVAHRWTEPFGRKRDEIIGQRLHVPFELWDGETLHRPGTLRTSAGTAFAVFTPFAKAFAAAAQVGPPLPAPKSLPPPPSDIKHTPATLLDLPALGIEPNSNLLAGGEKSARHRLTEFLKRGASTYDETRDRLDLAATSRMSVDLKFGTLSVRTLWSAVVDSIPAATHPARQRYLNELVWREFYYSTLADRPELLSQPFRHDFEGFPWRDEEATWQAWVTGSTGYPVVDASARQLLQEGFVHNRARMISASFLTKHLLTNYQRGEAHYLKYLTDGDWAQNNGGWQWSAGCGCDAQPYFRVFNPITQGEKFDPTGAYIRRWIPELARVPDAYIHAPWTAPASVLQAAGVQLGKQYAKPIVDHATARARYLDVVNRHLKKKG